MNPVKCVTFSVIPRPKNNGPMQPFLGENLMKPKKNMGKTEPPSSTHFQKPSSPLTKMLISLK
jgi:hypothetical protein